MSVFKYFMKTEHPQIVSAISPAHCCVSEELLPECSINMKEARGTKTTQVNAHMATADHDRQGQAAHRQYKSRTVVEFASGKSMHNRHSYKREKFTS